MFKVSDHEVLSINSLPLCFVFIVPSSVVVVWKPWWIQFYKNLQKFLEETEQLEQILVALSWSFSTTHSSSWVTVKRFFVSFSQSSRASWGHPIWCLKTCGTFLRPFLEIRSCKNWRSYIDVISLVNRGRLRGGPVLIWSKVVDKSIVYDTAWGIKSLCQQCGWWWFWMLLLRILTAPSAILFTLSSLLWKWIKRKINQKWNTKWCGQWVENK